MPPSLPRGRAKNACQTKQQETCHPFFCAAYIQPQKIHIIPSDEP
jgi:hypothetical protein